MSASTRSHYGILRLCRCRGRIRGNILTTKLEFVQLHVMLIIDSQDITTIRIVHYNGVLYEITHVDVFEWHKQI